jgi:hypothetical protein
MKKNLTERRRFSDQSLKVGISIYQAKASRHSPITALVDAPNEYDKMADEVFVDY